MLFRVPTLPVKAVESMRKLEESTEESIELCEHLARKRPLGALSVQPTYLRSPGRTVMTTKVVLDMVQYTSHFGFARYPNSTFASNHLNQVFFKFELST